MVRTNTYPSTIRVSRPLWQHMGWLLAVAFILFLPLAAIGGLLAVWGIFNQSDWIMPGVHAGNVALGGMTRADALKRLQEAYPAGRLLTVTDGIHSFQLGADELGLEVNMQATVGEAYRLGRSPDSLREWMESPFQGVNPVVTFDVVAARETLTRLAPQINQPAQNARLVFKDGHWLALPAMPGSELDVARTLQMAVSDPGTVLRVGVLPLAVNSLAPAVADLSSEVSRMQAILNQPLRFSAYDPINDETVNWQVQPEQMADWVTVSEKDGQPLMGLDESLVRVYLQAQPGGGRLVDLSAGMGDPSAAWREARPVELTLRRLATTYVVRQGDTAISVAWKTGIPAWMILRANPGNNLGMLTPGHSLVIPSQNDLLTLPVVRGKRIVISISEQRMRTYENGSLRNEWVISTGMANSPTQPGVFQVNSHIENAYAEKWDLYMPHFLGIYEAWPGFTNGIHGLPLLSNGRRLWADVLGRPASYGCIILGLDEAENLYQWAEDGVVVEIQP